MNFLSRDLFVMCRLVKFYPHYFNHGSSNYNFIYEQTSIRKSKHCWLLCMVQNEAKIGFKGKINVNLFIQLQENGKKVIEELCD